MKKKIKVLIVGAGPAGCAAAYFLKHFDDDGKIDAELVDRLKPNKYEMYHDMCGECVSKDSLADIKPLEPEGIVGNINLIREFYPKNIETMTKMNGFLIDRPKFFNSISYEFVKLGGEKYTDVVKDFLQKKNKVKIKFNEGYKEYDYIIAADGANSFFRKKLGLVGHTKTLIQYIVDKEPEKETIKFHYDEKYKGDYLWEFPHEANVKVGFPLIKGNIFKLNEKILKKQARMVAYGGLDKYSHGRILLVGDAACQTNPITKGGIRPSFVAGKIAAEAIIHENPKNYDVKFNNTKFSSKKINEAFESLKNMDNNELAEHIKPFINNESKFMFPNILFYLKTLLFYRRYIKIYQAYEICDKYGW